ncbi:MAG: DUF547 domain-containing protein [Verrucomicrobia bacterium]|nr:DUF547 domain-containing protein [Verrucomicrobiota bacterium]
MVRFFTMVFIRSSFFLLVVFLVQASGFATTFDHSHAAWDQVVKTHVRGSLVDYRALSADATILDGYLEQLNSVPRSQVDAWSREEQLAFWINAYNAFTVKAILNHYPIESWTFKGLFVPRNSIIQISGVWKKLEWKVAGQSLTLDHIEHGLIRPNFKEPRIHFSIVCASIGCPNLRPEAFTAEKLETQLDEQTRSHLLNVEKGIKLDFEKEKVCVSQLFSWFWEDFVVEPPAGFQVSGRSDKTRAALYFISHYFKDSRVRDLLKAETTDFDYLSYDWSLNDTSSSDDSAS